MTRSTRLGAAAGLALLLVAGAAKATDPVESGRAAYLRGEPALAFHEFSRGVMNNSAEARYLLGALYLQGEGIPQDRLRAAKLYSEAADQRFPPAMRDFGLMLLGGLVVEKNVQAGLSFIAAAAREDDWVAMSQLGDIYRDGDGVTPDRIEALKWYNLAAGHSAAHQAPDAAEYRDQFDSLARQMPEAEIRETRRRVERFLTEKKENTSRRR
jgi:TPR repeat protein